MTRDQSANHQLIDGEKANMAHFANSSLTQKDQLHAACGLWRGCICHAVGFELRP